VESFQQERAGKPWRQVKEFAGCGWLKVIRQAATHIVRYFLNYKILGGIAQVAVRRYNVRDDDDKNH
jgi:hypothetical protein